ncbi:hypothetical protein U9M48_019199 [Paspalum notatum var. saurae]|uniref:Uncharacterized protein n=1 Tax=Paspalum notatum var. saurae TaxID=547442 RepID=A0AAQ3WR00_PASNO
MPPVSPSRPPTARRPLWRLRPSSLRLRPPPVNRFASDCRRLRTEWEEKEAGPRMGGGGRGACSSREKRQDSILVAATTDELEVPQSILVSAVGDELEVPRLVLISAVGDELEVPRSASSPLPRTSWRRR